MSIEEVVKKLRKNHHILSKDYGDGTGRKYWLRTIDQEDVQEISAKDMKELEKKHSFLKQDVYSSDAGYLLALNEKALNLK